MKSIVSVFNRLKIKRFYQKQIVAPTASQILLTEVLR